MSLKIGVVDGGVGEIPPARLAAALRFVADDDGVPGRAPAHGAMVAALILAAAPAATLLDACVATATTSPTPRRVADAVHWCVDAGARVINLSLGLIEDREPLRAACARAIDAGVVLVAAAPARGAAVFPASYPGVLAVSGDARCADGDWSWLGVGDDEYPGQPRLPPERRSGFSPTSAPALARQGDDLRGVSTACRAEARPTMPMFNADGLFGASPQPLAGGFGQFAGGGASVAAARLSGIAAGFLLDHPQAGRGELLAFLAAHAAWRGRERRAVSA